MNICYSAKQAKAIKTLLYNQELDNANIQRLKNWFKKADDSDMTLDEAHRIVDKMPQAKKDALNDILSGKVQPLVPERYYMERNAEHLSKSIAFNILMAMFVIGVVAFGIILVCATFAGLLRLICFL